MNQPIVVISPLKIEHEALKRHLNESAPGMICLLGAHGKTQFGLHTLDAIDRLAPRLVICAGAAGALVERVRPGDVIVGESTIEHDYNLRFIKRPLPRFEAHAQTLSQLRKIQIADASFALHFGALASGDEDVMDAGRAAEIHAATEALAVAWEGAGGARACRFRNIPYIEIRAVSDTCSADSAAEFSRQIESAMHHLAAVLVKIGTEAPT